MSDKVRNAPDMPTAGPVEHLALPDETVDEIFSGLTAFDNLALGVSGGADSLCLLVVFSEWARRTGWAGRAEVITVDHGLRPESADEAAYVATVARDHGLPSKILRWEGTKPRQNLQEAARLARYRLIAEHMNAIDAKALLLGHHLDDQAETFLDRLTRGSGVSGLSAMSEDERNGPEALRLLRPFLSLPKSRLVASLRARNIAWREDPSNQDAKYKRSRLRRVMSALAEEGLTAERLAATAGRLRLAREALDETALGWFHQLAEEHPAGPLKLGRDAYRNIAEDLRLRLIVLIIGRVTGVHPRPRLQQLKSIDAALISKSMCRQALAGTFFEADAGTIYAWRETGRIPPVVLNGLIKTGVWDCRFRYSPAKDAPADEGTVLGPLCLAPVSRASIEWPEGWPTSAFDCAPVVWNEASGTICQMVSSDLRSTGTEHRHVLDIERLPSQRKAEGNHLIEEEVVDAF